MINLYLAKISYNLIKRIRKTLVPQKNESPSIKQYAKKSLNKKKLGLDINADVFITKR